MAYIVGRQPYLKLILNQSDAEKMSRILTYYRYISRDQVEAIQQLQTTIEQIQNNQQQIQSETSILKQLENNQQKEHNKLKHARELRKTLIQKILFARWLSLTIVGVIKLLKREILATGVVL